MATQSAKTGQVSVQILVNIDVDNLEKAIAFYRDGLGLSLGRVLFDATVAEMLGASSRIYLIEARAGVPATPEGTVRRDFNRHWTPVHLDFEVDDIESAVARAEATGAKLEAAIRSSSWGRLATMSDPFGHGFCLLQFSSGGYDAQM